MMGSGITVCICVVVFAAAAAAAAGGDDVRWGSRTSSRSC